MRTPTVYTASEVAAMPLEEYEPGRWRPDRPRVFSDYGRDLFTAIVELTIRFRIARRVFTGKYDALDWGDK